MSGHEAKTVIFVDHCDGAREFFHLQQALLVPLSRAVCEDLRRAGCANFTEDYCMPAFEDFDALYLHYAADIQRIAGTGSGRIDAPSKLFDAAIHQYLGPVLCACDLIKRVIEHEAAHEIRICLNDPWARIVFSRLCKHLYEKTPIRLL